MEVTEIMRIDWDGVRAALPRYEIGDILGSGGFGYVLSARHKLLDRRDAVKVISLEGEKVDRFRREGQVLAKLDHPNIVRVHDSVEHDSLGLIVMEFLDGGDLGQKMRKRISPIAACAIALAIAHGLQAAHESRVLHRDVKPQNILFDQIGRPKLSDFGIAKVLDRIPIVSTSDLGTQSYMPPEQVRGGELTWATDVHALGVVLSEMLVAGRQARQYVYYPNRWTGTNLKAVQPALPDRIAEVLTRSLSSEPKDRQDSAKLFAAELADAAQKTFGKGWTRRCDVPLNDSAV